MIERKQTQHESASCTNAAVETWYVLHVAEYRVGEIAECSRVASFLLLSQSSFLYTHTFVALTILIESKALDAVEQICNSPPISVQIRRLYSPSDNSSATGYKFVCSEIGSSVLERRAAWEDHHGMQITDYKLKSALKPGQRSRGDGAPISF